MKLKSNRTPSLAEMKATVEALEQVCADYEAELAHQDVALISTHGTLLHLIGVIKYTKNQPDQVDFDGIQARLEDTCSTIMEVLS